MNFLHFWVVELELEPEPVQMSAPAPRKQRPGSGPITLLGRS